MADAIASIPSGVEAPTTPQTSPLFTVPAQADNEASTAASEESSGEESKDESSSGGEAATLEEALDTAGAEDAYDYLQALGDQPHDVVDPSDEVFSRLESAVLAECARHAEGMGVAAEDLLSLSEFCRSHSDLQNVLAEFGGSKSREGFSRLVRSWQDHRLIEVAAAAKAAARS